jgi:hypothetical protein
MHAVCGSYVQKHCLLENFIHVHKDFTIVTQSQVFNN